jgi:hypothetical protein
MDTHVKTLGALNIWFGVVAGLIAGISLTTGGGVLGIYRYFDAPMVGAVMVTLVIFSAVTAVPALLGGIFVRRYHAWARTLLIITSALNMLNPPIGTMLGGYGLWVLMSQEVDPLFDETPPALRPGRSHPPGRRLEKAALDEEDGTLPRPLKSGLDPAAGTERP